MQEQLLVERSLESQLALVILVSVSLAAIALFVAHRVRRRLKRRAARRDSLRRRMPV